MVRRKVLHLAVIFSMLLTMVGVVLPAAVGATSLQYAPGALVFPPQQVGTTSEVQEVKILNSDAGAVTIDNVVALPGSDFIVNPGGCFANTLSNGQTCSFYVSFTPSSIGSISDVIFINRNGGAQSPYSVSGISTSPSVSISTPGSATPMALSFGEQQVRVGLTQAYSAPQEIRFTNTGTGPVTFVTKFFSGGALSLLPPFVDYRFTGDTCFPGDIQPGDSCSLWVSFAPLAPGPQDGEANFVIFANGAPLDMSVVVRGTGVYPKGDIDKTELDFGNQLLFTQSAAQTITLKNEGTGPLTVPSGGPQLDGLNQGDFEIIDNHCQGGVVIPVGGECTFGVYFRPLADGIRIARVEFDIPGSDRVTTLQGVGVRGTLKVEPSVLDFQTQQAGTTDPTPQVVTITNTGPYPVQINDWDLSNDDDFEILSDTCNPGTLDPQGGPHDSCTISVIFHPQSTTLGEVNAFLDIEHDGNGGNSVIELAVLLHGVGVTVNGHVDKTQLNFGPSTVGLWSAPQKVTFFNDGDGPITIPSDLAFDAGIGNPGFFIQANTCLQGFVVPKGGTCSFEVVFLPNGTPGPKIAAITIDPLVNFQVTLNAIVANGTVALQTNSLDFGDQPVGVQSAPKTVELKSTSDLLVLVNSAMIAGADPNFVLTNNSCVNAVLMNGQSCKADVSFKPQAQGPVAGALEFSTNATGSPHTATLLGNGVLAVAVLEASAVDFGNQQINTTSAVQTITVTNKGPGNLIINGVSLTGANAADYIIYFNNGCAGQLAPNATCQVQVKFKPTALGARNAFLEFDTNAAGAPNQVSLTGNGTPVPTYLVTTTVIGAGCTVSAAPVGPYQANDMVSLTANYNPAGTVFLGWTLDGTFVGFASPLQLSINGSSHNVQASCVAKPAFTDVNAATPYNDAILQLAARGVIKGYGGGDFGPNDGIVRAQMAALTTRLAGWNNLVKPNIFTDRCSGQSCIDDELWNAVAVTAFFQVARGYEDNTFRPFDPVANIQAVAFITRTMVKLGYWEFQPDNPSIYPNVSTGTGHRVDISTYYHYAGAVPGTNPANAWTQWDQGATRGFFAAIYWQAYQSYFSVDHTP